MTPSAVVDIGNSRLKCARVLNGRLATPRSISNREEKEWEASLRFQPDEICLIAGVVPRAVDRFRDWITGKQVRMAVLDNETMLKSLPDFRTAVNEPQRVGIDRLLNAYAAFRLASEREAKPMAVAAVSVGTAMTVDFVESDGIHLGGAILPGPRLMAKSLAEETAKLPTVEVGRYLPTLHWGADTAEAIRLGITRAIVHAADGLIRDWAEAAKPHCIFLTGGDAALFHDFTFSGSWLEVSVEPALTLEGLRLVAEKLP